MAVMLAALSGLSDSLRHHPLGAAVALFLAGVATSTNPCIWPMIPITIGVINGGGGSGGEARSRGRTALLVLVYAAGLALLYATLGLVAGLSGSLFGSIGSSPWSRLVIAALLAFIFAPMLTLMPALAAWAAGQRGGSVPGAFLLGASSGIVAAPCGAPAFAVVLTWVTTTHSAVLGFVYLTVFSLGMTAVLVGVGLFTGLLSALPRPGMWMVWVKRVAGAIMLGMAGYYVYLAWEVW